MGLSLRQVAKQIGVNKYTIIGWEKHGWVPYLHRIPKIIEFLGYIPPTITKDMSLGGKIMAYRKITGTLQSQLARQLGVDASVLRKWERNKSVLQQKRFQEAIDSLLRNGNMST